jgi:pterin-4a-carbinolamine dehydratase
MSAALPLPEGWRVVERPPALFRRFVFASYSDTRQFLERLAALSSDTGLYPDLGFGPTHVNVTVLGADGHLPGATEVEFASRAAALAEPVQS